MIPPRRLLLTEFLKLVDLLVMIASFGLAFWVATGQLARAEFIARHVTKIESVTKAVALMIVWHLIYTFFNLYGSRRLLSRWQEAKDQEETFGRLLDDGTVAPLLLLATCR